VPACQECESPGVMEGQFFGRTPTRFDFVERRPPRYLQAAYRLTYDWNPTPEVRDTYLIRGTFEGAVLAECLQEPLPST
jgi:hypothetical protein